MAISPLSPSPPTQGKAQSQERKPQTAQQVLDAAFANAATPKLGTGDAPLALVLKAAIEKLNEYLMPELGENAIQNAAASGIDFTPQSTADRIVSLSTGFYEAFKQQHKGENSTDVLNKFMQTIGKGIEQGFKEASNILHGLKVLNGAVASNIEQTYNLVQQGLNAFHEEMGKGLSPSTAGQAELHPDWNE